jgi:hypothetical protein
MSKQITEEEVKLILLNGNTGIPKPECEYKFDDKRKWRFDFAWPKYKVALEIEGATFGRQVICNYCNKKVYGVTKNGGTYPIRIGGRHTSGVGFEKDCEKYNAATLAGWRVLRFPTKSYMSDVLTACSTLIANYGDTT